MRDYWKRFGVLGKRVWALSQLVAFLLVAVVVVPDVMAGEPSHESKVYGIPGSGGPGGGKIDFQMEVGTYDYADGWGEYSPPGGQQHFDCENDYVYYYYELEDMGENNGNAQVVFDYWVQYRESGSNWSTYYSFDSYYYGPHYSAIAVSGWFKLANVCDEIECQGYEWRLKVEVTDNYDNQEEHDSYSPIFYYHDEFDPEASMPTFPDGTSESSLNNNSELRVRMHAVDNVEVTGLRLRYEINNGQEYYLPSETEWYPVSGSDVSYSTYVPIPTPAEGVQVEVRTYARDCEGLDDSSSSTTIIISDSDTSPPTFSNCIAEEGPGADNDGFLETNETIRFSSTITDVSGVDPTSVTFGGYPYDGQSGDTYYKDFTSLSGQGTIEVVARDLDIDSQEEGSCAISYTIVPQTYEVVVTTQPELVDVIVDGVPYPAPATFQWGEGSTHTIEAVSWQEVGPGVSVSFDQWDNSSTEVIRELTVSGDDYVVAGYNYQYLLEIATNPPDIGIIEGAGWYNMGDSIEISAPGSIDGFSFDHFEIDGAGNFDNPVVVVMDAPHGLVAYYNSLVEVHVASIPVGVPIVVDGVPVVSPQTFLWEVGSEHTLEAPEIFGEENMSRWVFDNWNNDEAYFISYTVSGPENLLCEYIQEHYLIVGSDPDIVEIPGEGYYPLGAEVSLNAPAAEGAYSFTGWLVNGEETTPPGENPTAVEMLTPITAIAEYSVLTNLLLSPDHQVVEYQPGVDNEFSISVDVENVVNLYGFEIDVFFDSQHLDVVSVSEGPFLGSDGETTFWLGSTIDEENGLVSNIGATRLSAGVGVSGAGSLVEIVFEVVNDPEPGTILNIGLVEEGTILLDPDAQVMDLGTFDGATVEITGSSAQPIVDIPENIGIDFAQGDMSVQETTFEISNIGTGVLEATISSDFTGYTFTPSSVSLSESESAVIQVLYQPSGCREPEDGVVVDEITIGPNWGTVLSYISDDWFYMVATGPDTLRIYSDGIGNPAEGTIAVENQACGDVGLATYGLNDEFTSETLHFSPDQTSEIVVQYSPTNAGNDTTTISFSPEISNSGGVLVSNEVVCIGINGYIPPPIIEICDLQDYTPSGAPQTPFMDDLVTVEGVVFVAPYNYSSGSGGYLADDACGLNFHRFEDMSELQEGDRIRMTGSVWSDWNQEIYLGDFSYEILEGDVPVHPTEYTVSELVGDYQHIGSFVRVTATATAMTADSFFLDDGENQVRVERSDYAGVSFDGISEGATITVQGPCLNNSGSLVIKPRRQSDILQSIWMSLDLNQPTAADETNGVSMVDLNGDGFPDLSWANADGAPAALMVSDEGNVFYHMPAPLVEQHTSTVTLAWGAADADTIPDLYVDDFSPTNALLLNDFLDFSDITTAPLAGPGPTRDAVWVDYDQDGRLDIHLLAFGGADRLYRNLGLGQFEEVLCGDLAIEGYSVSAAWCDADNDGDPDCYVSLKQQPNVLIRNDGGGVFAAVDLPLLGDDAWGQGVSWSDFNNDGWMDLYLCNADAANVLFENQGESPGDLAFSEVPGLVADTGVGQSGVWLDYNLDGWMDLFLTNMGGQNRLFENQAGEQFVSVSDALLAVPAPSLGAAVGDMDLDGDPDILVGEIGNNNHLYRNDQDSGNHWLTVRLRVPGDYDHSTFANSLAIGARVTVYTASGFQVQEIGSNRGMWSQNPIEAHFGLGDEYAVSELRVRWPWGAETVHSVTDVDRVLTLEAGSSTEVPEGQPSLSRFELYSCVPNPFNPMTTVRYHLPRSSQVELVIYNVSGRLVRTLVREANQPAGNHEVVWMGRDQSGKQVSSGTYFCHMRAGGFSETRRMTLVK